MTIPDQYKFCRWKDICVGFLDPELDPNCGRYHTTCSLATFMDIDENRELVERMRKHKQPNPNTPSFPQRPLPSWEDIQRDKYGKDETGKPLFEWGLP